MQDIGFVEQKFPGMRWRTVAARFMQDRKIALFKLTLKDNEVRVVEKQHYRLAPAGRLKRRAVSSSVYLGN